MKKIVLKFYKLWCIPWDTKTTNLNGKGTKKACRTQQAFEVPGGLEPPSPVLQTDP